MYSSTKGRKGSEHIPTNRFSAGSDEPAIRPNDQITRKEEGVRVDTELSRILIVDDDLEILKLVARMARSLGYHVTTAVDALDALFLLNKIHYDLVLTDYAMPFIDGLQLANQVKKKQSATRIIIMTGNCDQAFKDMLQGSAIVDGLLLKPFNLDTMKETLETVSRACIGPWSY